MNAYEPVNKIDGATTTTETLRDKISSINSRLIDAEIFSDQIAEILYGGSSTEIAKSSEINTMEEALDDMRARVERLTRNLSKIKYMTGG